MEINPYYIYYIYFLIFIVAIVTLLAAWSLKDSEMMKTESVLEKMVK